MLRWKGIQHISLSADFFQALGSVSVNCEKHENLLFDMMKTKSATQNHAALQATFFSITFSEARD